MTDTFKIKVVLLLLQIYSLILVIKYGIPELDVLAIALGIIGLLI